MPSQSDPGMRRAVQVDATLGAAREEVVALGHSVLFASSDTAPVTVAGDTPVVAAPGAGKHLRVRYLHASNGSATPVEVMWRSAGGARRLRTWLAQYGAFGHNLRPDYWDLPTNTALVLSTSAAGSIHWTVEYETVSD